MQNCPSDWTVLHLGTTGYCKNAFDKNHSRREKINEYIMIGDNEGRGTWAYALSEKGIDYLIKTFSKKKQPADGMINWLTGSWDKNKDKYGKGYVAINQIFLHEFRFESEIRGRGRDEQKHLNDVYFFLKII